MIKGIQLTNFMSYKDAYIPLKPGLNLILGPNGAGKSSILLAISLVLGQSYTERGRRLSELIRWGEEEASISLIIDNTERWGKPFRNIRKETVKVGRILKKDGDYYYLLEDKITPKRDVQTAFNSIGVDPENMLLIMHQLMVVKFSSTSAQEKLRMLEEAAGFQSYRSDLTEAEWRLKEAMVEERRILDSLNATLDAHDYWKREYEKLKKKRMLESRLRELNAEMAWSRVSRREEHILRAKEKLSEIREEIIKLRRTLEAAEVEAISAKSNFQEALERIDKVSPREVQAYRRELSLKAEEWVNSEVNRAVSKKSLEEALEKYSILEAQIRILEAEAEDLRRDAENLGTKPPISRKAIELASEIGAVEAELKPLRDVSEDVEEVYLSYTGTLEDLKKKAEEVASSRRQLLKELEERMKEWRRIIQGYLRDLNESFNEILSAVGGVGSISLRDAENVEKAGLEISAAFGSSTPRPLDSLSQSGGE
ncbi:MAG: AAA family ATPase [Candidatus Bathyarchaeia archaeon]